MIQLIQFKRQFYYAIPCFDGMHTYLINEIINIYIISNIVVFDEYFKCDT